MPYFNDFLTSCIRINGLKFHQTYYLFVIDKITLNSYSMKRETIELENISLLLLTNQQIKERITCLL